MLDSIEAEQLAICTRFGVTAVPSPGEFKVGIAHNVKEGLQPLNALRHPPEGDTTGWYIWAGGEPDDDPEFFEPLHVSHLAKWCPEIVPYLLLPPGSRVLIAPGYEDVWEDRALLDLG
jgi:hypothetical protein